jgi:hypothetical protein
MLTEGDRNRLAPQLATVRIARVKLAGARRTAAQAQQRAAESKRRTTVWDRWFNRDTAAGRAYREARKAHDDAVAVVSGRQERVGQLCRSLDRQIEPMMPRLNSRYELVTLVIENCEYTVQECRVTRQAIQILASTVRAATQNGRGGKARQAALRYPDELAKARKAASTAKQAVETTRKAVIRTGGRQPRLEWNAAALDQLPRTADNSKALQRLTHTLPSLQATLPHLDRLRRELNGLRKRAVTAQQNALIDARKRLITESEQ